MALYKELPKGEGIAVGNNFEIRHQRTDAAGNVHLTITVKPGESFRLGSGGEEAAIDVLYKDGSNARLRIYAQRAVKVCVLP